MLTAILNFLISILPGNKQAAKAGQKAARQARMSAAMKTARKRVIVRARINAAAEATQKPSSHAAKKPDSQVKGTTSDRNTFKHFYSRESVLSAAENKFMACLQAAIQDGVTVIPKIRVEDVIGVKRKGREYGDYQSDRGKIKSRHFDFVLVNRGYKPIAVIELDDASHNTAKAEAADAFKNALCQHANLPIYRFPAHPTPSSTQIEEKMDLSTSAQEP